MVQEGWGTTEGLEERRIEAPIRRRRWEVYDPTTFDGEDDMAAAKREVFLTFMGLGLAVEVAVLAAVLFFAWHFWPAGWRLW